MRLRGPAGRLDRAAHALADTESGEGPDCRPVRCADRRPSL